MKRLFPILLALGVLLAAGCHRHTPGPEATCAAPQVCTECGEELSPQLEHTPGAAATCTEPQVCTVCGAVLAPALGHTPGAEATCTEPQVCTVCGEVLTEALGHTPVFTGCLEPEYCSVCGEEVEPAPGHIASEDSCTEDTVCTVCGEELKHHEGHDVDTETGICRICGETVTEPGVTYYRPGTTLENDETVADLIPETENTGHYNQTVSAYYADNVLICGDYGMEYFRLDSSGDSRYASIVNDFAARFPDVHVSCMIVPKCAAYEAPEGYEDPHDSIRDFISATYDMMDDSVTTVDAMSVMDEHAGEYMFYRTDHHWTSLGAYYASRAYCEANGITPRELADYVTIYRSGVIGTLDYYSGHDANLSTNPDYTACHYPDTGYTMQYTYGSEWYDMPAIDGTNKGYAYVFMGGDLPLTVIHTDNKNGKNLIVFKESYGNAFIPYMIDYYETIVVVDDREASVGVGTLIERYSITDALIINNCQAVSSIRGDLQDRLVS